MSHGDLNNLNIDLCGKDLNNSYSTEKIQIEIDGQSFYFDQAPKFEIVYKSEELNRFKDEILLYLNERNRFYMHFLKSYQDKMELMNSHFETQIKNLSENSTNLIKTQAKITSKLDKIPDYEISVNKLNDQIITHEIRIKNLSDDFLKATQKYDKIYLDNLELPGFIGPYAKFKNCKTFFDYVLREFNKINQYKEKNIMDVKAYKEKLENIIKSINLLIKNNNDAQFQYIRTLNERNIKDCKEMYDVLNNRVTDLRIENSKYSMEIIDKGNEMTKELAKILDMKENLSKNFDDKMQEFKILNNNTTVLFNNHRKDFNDLKKKLQDVFSVIIKEISPSKENIAIIESTGAVKKKSMKNLPKNLFKKCKTNNIFDRKGKTVKNFNYSSSQIAKITNNIENLNKNFNSHNLNFPLIEKDSDKENKNNNDVSNITNININQNNNNKNTPLSVDKYDSESHKINYNSPSNNYSNNKKANHYSKSINKIKINSQVKKIFGKLEKKDENSENLEKKRLKTDENINEKNTSFEPIEINNNYGKNLSNKNVKITVKELMNSNKIKNDEKKYSECNSISANNNTFNLNNTFNTSNENNNYSFLSSNTLYSSNFNLNNHTNNNNNNNKMVNEFVLVEQNDKVIKELESELEQSTMKKDKIVSNAKKIEDNFKNICDKIEPINLNIKNKINENNEEIINENEEINKEIINEKEEEPKKIFDNEIIIKNKRHSLQNRINDISTEDIKDTITSMINKTSNNNILQNQKLKNIGNIIKSVEKENKDDSYTLDKEKEITATKSPKEQKDKCEININITNDNKNDNILNEKFDKFEKKINDIEALFSEKISNIFSQMENIKNMFNNSLSNSFCARDNSKLFNKFYSMKLKPKQQDLTNNDITVHENSPNNPIKLKKTIAPIIEINPLNLHFSPNSSQKACTKMNKKLSEGFDIKKASKGFVTSSSVKDYSSLNNRMDSSPHLSFHHKGVNKWVNLADLLKYDNSKIVSFDNNKCLLSNENI